MACTASCSTPRPVLPAAGQWPCERSCVQFSMVNACRSTHSRTWGLAAICEYQSCACSHPAGRVQVPVWLLKTTRNFLRSFQWARDAADRLVSGHRSHAC